MIIACNSAYIQTES